MQDRFYIGGDLGKREIETPRPFQRGESSFSQIDWDKARKVEPKVIHVYNPKIEETPIKF